MNRGSGAHTSQSTGTASTGGRNRVYRLLVVLCVLVVAAAGPFSTVALAATGGGPSGSASTATTSAASNTTAAAASIAENDSEFCSFEHPEWRETQSVAGVDLTAEDVCRPDNPYRVASFVKGTNHVPMDVRMRTGLDEDAVVKHTDRDGDGDPDVVNVTVEVIGVNEDRGGSVPAEIAPGKKPSFWVFAPKTNGMVRDGSKAASAIRMPSPPIRVEQGDTMYLTVENTHYFPHTIHLHGVDHRFAVNGTGNDGVPQTSERPIMPGESRTYRIQPREAGTMFYHCHVVPSVHVKMGLNGMFVVEENASDNHVQTFNIGAGKVRHPDADTAGEYAGEFDLHYQEIDATLHEIPNETDDPATLARRMNREYDSTDASPDYFLLNGKSFPATTRESIVPVEQNERYRMHLLNGGSKVVSLHTHGHKFTIEAYDGVELAESQEVTRDVLTLSAAQRVDITLNTTNDGLHSYGPGTWIFHDHDEKAVTTDGISPGGTVSMITYQSHQRANGLPETSVNLSKFDAAYYAGEEPFWSDLRLREGDHHEGSESDDHHEGSESGSHHGHGGDSGGHGGGHGGMGMSGGMMMDMSMHPNGTVVNENTDRLPPGCEAIRGTTELTVHAGGDYADDGEMFSYERDSRTVDPCTRVEVTLVNHDEVRHQWMIHGLPSETYPMGMFNVESDAGGTVTGTFVTPAETGPLSAHCSLPNHERMGMEYELLVQESGGSEPATTATAGGSGDAAADEQANQRTGTAGGQEAASETASAAGPGFGAVSALLALAMLAVLVAARRPGRRG